MIEQMSELEQKQANRMIESCSYVMREMHRWTFCSEVMLSLDRAAEYIDAGIYSQELVDFFRSRPFGQTDRYQWETKRVDYLINVHLWLVKSH